jgi:hypothetical protein
LKDADVKMYSYYFCARCKIKEKEKYYTYSDLAGRKDQEKRENYIKGSFKMYIAHQMS